ncbi:hypothetical protein CLIB1423_01S08152 [[Candida] railenensis]|uniref:Uncharacterized protein n=1 Tax=[Candida] railenensis TaxID=45579 RepID=A0A9P0VVX8_9ASCO|nr:hypothetical protein CLIB1423_01S08152 [[Candida] railenensis]
MEKKQNSKTHSIMGKAAVAFLVSSSIASIIVLVTRRAGDLSRASCMGVTMLVVITSERKRAMRWGLAGRWIMSTALLFSSACDAYCSYVMNLQTPTAATIAICELMVGTCFAAGCLLVHSYTLAQDHETLAHRCDEIEGILGFFVIMPPYNLCFKTIPFAWICLFRQGTVGNSHIERILMERGLICLPILAIFSLNLLSSLFTKESLNLLSNLFTKEP